MAIAPSLLRLSTGELSFTGNYFSMGWQVLATNGDVVASGTVSQTVAKLGELDQAHSALLIMAGNKLAEVQDWHKGRSIVGGYSAFDSNLILDGWWLDNGNLVHPVSGTFAVSFADSLTNRVNIILSKVLGPPIWAWAESIAPGQLRVKCQAVSGADHYHVYNGDILLGEVPTAAWNILAVPAGIYSIRIAAVTAAGVVGIRWQAIPVEVAAGGLDFMPSAYDAIPGEVKKKNVLRRFWTWFNDPAGILDG